MILVPKIDSIERTLDGLTLGFVVSATLEYFDGHFSDCPLLPGVVQIGWAIELARQHALIAGRFRSLAAVKFMRVIQPGTTLALLLQIDPEKNALSFEYRSSGEICSGGRVLFQ